MISDIFKNRPLKWYWQVANYFVTGYELSYVIPKPPYLPGDHKTVANTRYGIEWVFATTPREAKLKFKQKVPSYVDVLHVTEHPGLVRRIRNAIHNSFSHVILNR